MWRASCFSWGSWIRLIGLWSRPPCHPSGEEKDLDQRQVVPMGLDHMMIKGPLPWEYHGCTTSIIKFGHVFSILWAIMSIITLYSKFYLMFFDPGYIFPQEMIRYHNPNRPQLLEPKIQGSAYLNTKSLRECWKHTKFHIKWLFLS